MTLTERPQRCPPRPPVVPVPSTVTEADWPLITYEEALALGEVEDHAEIEALIERACGRESSARLARAGASRALRRLDRHVLARLRQVG